MSKWCCRDKPERKVDSRVSSAPGQVKHRLGRKVVGGAHLRFFELHEPEPSESQPTPQANVKLIRRLVLKERFARLPPRPDPALLVILSIIHHRVPPRLLFPPLEPPHSLPNDSHDFLIVALDEQEIGQRLEVAVPVRVQEVDRLGRDERADGAVVGERGEQDGRRARVLLRVGEEGRKLPQGSGVMRQEGQKRAERFDSLRDSETSGSAPGCRPPAR